MSPNSEPITEEIRSCDGKELIITSGIKKYPSNRNSKLKNPDLWLEGKKEDDGVYPYWRVHDKLYDLTSFVNSHPGGTFWIEETRGTDITESFESSHFGTLPEKVLQKYFVEDTDKPRNSSFTFHEEGFYRTLKRKVSPIVKSVGTGPSFYMKLIQDSLLFAFLVFSFLAARNTSVAYAFIAGIFVSLMINVAHNFFHQRDNWRMFIFDLTLNSSRDWRISHALSHHNYPNTIVDFEVSSLEPHFELLPKAGKSFAHRYVVIITGSILYSVAIYFAFAYKLILYQMGKTKFYRENILPFLHLFSLVTISGSVIEGIKLWLIIHTVGYYLFTLIGLTAGHHHPNIYHEGDKHLDEKDWGLHQISATRERGELFMRSIFLSSVSFGNHTLHHLFPTVDHSKLPYLQEALLETCREFDVKFEVYTPWQTFKGLYLQLASVRPNSNLPSIFKKKFRN